MGLNEMLLYGGGALALVSVIAMIIFQLVCRLKRGHINEQMRKEYGEW